LFLAANEKRHPPRLDDELYRLEEISRDGVYHRRLHDAKIYKVEGFLKALNEDSNKLRRVRNSIFNILYALFSSYLFHSCDVVLISWNADPQDGKATNFMVKTD